MTECIILLFILMVAFVGGRSRDFKEEMEGFDHIWELDESGADLE